MAEPKKTSWLKKGHTFLALVFGAILVVLGDMSRTGSSFSQIMAYYQEGDWLGEMFGSVLASFAIWCVRRISMLK